MAIGPTNAYGGTLDILVTEIPRLVYMQVTVVELTTIGGSLSTATSIAQAAPNLCVSGTVFLKHRVNFQCKSYTLRSEKKAKNRTFIVNARLLFFVNTFFVHHKKRCFEILKHVCHLNNNNNNNNNN